MQMVSKPRRKNTGPPGPQWVWIFIVVTGGFAVFEGLQHLPLSAITGFQWHLAMVLAFSVAATYLIHRVLTRFRDLNGRLEQAEEQRLAYARQQREKLVQEVHHRIKNSLQSVGGLVRRHIGAHPEARPVLEAAVEQIQTIGIVHGLQGREATEHLHVCDLLAEIGRHSPTTGAIRIATCPVKEGSCPARIDPGEAVPVALIINELVANAYKHSRSLEIRIEVT